MGRHGAALSILLGTIALGYGFATSPGYYADFTGRILVMWGGAATLTAVAWLPLPLGSAGRSKAYWPRLEWGGFLCGALILLALFGWWIRPHLEPFAEFVPSMGQQGRDFRENTLRDLAAYLSPPGMVLMLVGVCLALRRVMQVRDVSWAPLLAMWFGCTLLYLYNPYISVDHIWKMRRFVPVIIPGMVVLLALGAQGITAALPASWGKFLVPAFLVATVLAWIGWTMVPLGFTQLNAGAVDFIRTINRAIPADDLLVATVNKPLLGPLQLVEQTDTVRALPGNTTQQEILHQVVAHAQSEGRPVMLLSSAPLVANPRRDARRFELVHPNLLRTTEPPPRTIESRRRTAFLSVLGPSGLGIAPTDPEVRLGANRIYGVTESGFSGQEYVAGIPCRWTLGSQASRSIPAGLGHPPLPRFHRRHGGSSAWLSRAPHHQ
ncbi:MAG: hypothetical protein J6386_13930 [Candidatus Synoicihabitans palmerolidicus]|nr:hypothetical protein [Candidatus Synoicihabitans palmerolidicus]